jgi:hypothetical protein
MTTTIYASVAGAPFAAQTVQAYRLADCFYYQMVQVEKLLPSAALASLPVPTPAATASTDASPVEPTPAPQNDYSAAIDAYEALLATRQPLACLSIPNELSELRDFVSFRLVVLHAAAGDEATARGFLPLLASPGMRTLADRFLDTYNASGDLAQACAAVAAQAASQPESWSVLLGWGVPALDLSADTLCRYRR